MNSVEILGFIAGALGVAIGVPQALQVRRLGHAKGVSLPAWIFMYLMFCSWGFYGIRIDSPSTIVSNFVTLIVLASVLWALINSPLKSISSIIILTAVDGYLILNLPESIVSILLIISVFSQLPQVIKSFKNRKTEISSAVSKRALQISIVSVSLWAVYAILREVRLMFFTACIAITMSSLVLIFESKRKKIPA